MIFAWARQRMVACFAMACSAVGTTPSHAQESPDPVLSRELRPLLQQFCFRCHGEDKPKGDITLSTATTNGDLVSDYRLWHRVKRAVRDEVMPPRKQRKQPTGSQRKQIVAAIDSILGEGARRLDPGRPVLQRLNRRQYDRTVTDLLLGLPFRSAQRFPKDPQGYGFDTVGDVLFASPMLIEKYLDVTQIAIDQLRARRDLLTPLIPSRPHWPSEVHDAATAALQPLLRRAFRRLPTPVELRSRLALIDAELRRGVGFEAAVLTAFQSVLLAPDFLFRVEVDRESDRPWAISDDELAVRLSYFLWSTMPDARLFQLAAAQTLHEDAVLRAEVHRMLDDPRSRSLADDFAAQWLGYRAIRQHAVDFRRFKGFSQGLKDDLYEESARFFDDLVRGNRPITMLLDADFGFLNQRLAKHYGVPGVTGGKLRKVAFADRRRGGVLGMASILTTTSEALRTSPVKRGKWILDNLLGDPPAPPPPDAGVLPADDQQRDDLTLRQRLERHRREARCAACHDKIDPLGFALEPYDGIGRWRTENHGRPIDAKAKMPDGRELDGPVALKDWLLDHKNQFLRTAATKLMVYALGRELALPDEKVLDDIVAAARNDEDRTRTLIEAVVLSYPFRHRRHAKD